VGGTMVIDCSGTNVCKLLINKQTKKHMHLV
jgi:hypothetical protein